MKCPYCNSTNLTLLKRTPLTWLIPGLEYYDCPDCGGTHSRLFFRFCHSLTMGIAAFLITMPVCWIMWGTPAPRYNYTEEKADRPPESIKVSGKIRPADPVQTKKSVQTAAGKPGDISSVPRDTDAPAQQNTSKTEAATRPPATTTSPLTSPAPAGRPSIKILIGNGRAISARRLASKLRVLGYPVDTIDTAPRSNFPRLTIYYKDNFKDAANRIGHRLAEDFLVNPISWESRFDLIMVTGGE